MTNPPASAAMLLILHIGLQVGLIVRALLRPHRDPASRIAWVLVLASMPVIGILAYVLLGEVNIGRRRVERMRATLSRMPALNLTSGMQETIERAEVQDLHAPLFRLGRSISGFPAVGGNRGDLLPDSNASIDAIVADIDAAKDHVHLLFYIWLPDHNGCRVAEALKRVAAHGLVCRAMADDMGSQPMIRSPHWQAMRDAGVRLARALPVGNLLVRALKGRIDLRNHRKIVVVDNRITYCGSQNCADPEFRIQAKYAPWVDTMMRFEGPIARQNQYLFAADWMAQVDDDLTELLRRPLEDTGGMLTAQVIGTGPTVRYAAMPELFETLMYAARRELIITTPYYVPDEAMQAALCASARRGVGTRIVFPARNNNWIVAAASRSYYGDLLGAGVKIFEYLGGLLHTKSLTLDGEVTLVGYANMDRRSFELNYENNILLHDPVLTAEMRRRQVGYLTGARPVTKHSIAAWTRRRRLWNNGIAMLGPVL